MEQGPLPLAEALVYARDVANQLRDLHEEGRAHGEVGARLVMLRQSGGFLMPPTGASCAGGSLADVVAFGSLFYEMLTSRKPDAETLLSTPLEGPPRKGPGAVQAAAVRLAERCLAATPDSGPSMQKVLTELRLMTVQARQWQTGDESKPGSHSASGGPEVRKALRAPEMDLIHRGEGDLLESGPPPRADGEEEDPLGEGRCPRCRCSKVRVSRPRNRLERFLRAIGLPVRRCHRCYFRYIDLFKACLEMPTKKYNR